MVQNYECLQLTGSAGGRMRDKTCFLVPKWWIQSTVAGVHVLVTRDTLINSQNSWKNSQESGEKVFLPFPKPAKDLEKCQGWISACSHKNFTVTVAKMTKDTYICKAHWPDGKGPTSDFPDRILWRRIFYHCIICWSKTNLFHALASWVSLQFFFVSGIHKQLFDRQADDIKRFGFYFRNSNQGMFFLHYLQKAE